jgi:hypothetical protein
VVEAVEAGLEDEVAIQVDMEGEMGFKLVADIAMKKRHGPLQEGEEGMAWSLRALVRGEVGGVGVEVR